MFIFIYYLIARPPCLQMSTPSTQPAPSLTSSKGFVVFSLLNSNSFPKLLSNCKALAIHGPSFSSLAVTCIPLQPYSPIRCSKLDQRCPVILSIPWIHTDPNCWRWWRRVQCYHYYQYYLPMTSSYLESNPSSYPWRSSPHTSGCW